MSDSAQSINLIGWDHEMMDIISALLFIAVAGLGLSYQVFVQLNLMLMIGSIGLFALSLLSLHRSIAKRNKQNLKIWDEIT